MVRLADLQTRFSAALSERSVDETMLALIVGDNATAARRLAIYRGNIASNATGALAAIYPIVRKLVGDDFFNALAVRYSHEHPSASGDLNELGVRLADFLQTFDPAISLPYLSDVARLEWKAHRAHYAADHARLDPSALAALIEGELAHLKLELHPAVAVVSSAYPLFRIWQVHQADFDGDIEVDLGSGGDHVVVFRPEFRATMARITAAQAHFLEEVQRGSPLGFALDAALAVDAGFDLVQSLQEWVIANIVVAIGFPDSK